MRRSCKILIKSIIIIILSFAVWVSLTYYLQLKQVLEWYSYELTITRGISIGLLNTLFYGSDLGYESFGFGKKEFLINFLF